MENGTTVMSFGYVRGETYIRMRRKFFTIVKTLGCPTKMSTVGNRKKFSRLTNGIFLSCFLILQKDPISVQNTCEKLRFFPSKNFEKFEFWGRDKEGNVHKGTSKLESLSEARSTDERANLLVGDPKGQ